MSEQHPTIQSMSDQHPTILSQYGSQKGGVNGVRFRPNMKHLVSGGGDSVVYLWSMHCRPNLRHPVVRPYRYLGHQGPVYAVAVCPLDTLVASASRDRSIRLWIPTVEGKSTAIKGHTGPVRTVNFSPDGQWILSGSDDKTIKIWQVSSHRFVCALSGHMNWVRSAEFSRSGRQVVSGSDDRTVRLWDIEYHQCITQFPDALGEVRCARFHPDNACIASGTSDHCIQIWDVRSKSLIQHYAANAGVVHSVCFHPAGNYLLSTCEDATLKIWDLREGQIVFTLQGHDGATRSADFSPTGEFFASGSADEHVALWRTNVDLIGGQPGALRGVVRKDEVGHSLCSACNCLCTSAAEECSMHNESSSIPPDVNCVKKCPTFGRLMTPRPPTPPKKYNADSSDSTEGDRSGEENNTANQTLTVNIHKNLANIQVPDCTSFQKAPEVAENEVCTAALYPKDSLCNLCEDQAVRSRQKRSKTPRVPMGEMKAVEKTLQQICQQLDMLTQTVALFEERLCHSENKMLGFQMHSSEESGDTVVTSHCGPEVGACRPELHPSR